MLHWSHVGRRNPEREWAANGYHIYRLLPNKFRLDRYNGRSSRLLGNYKTLSAAKAAARRDNVSKNPTGLDWALIVGGAAAIGLTVYFMAKPKTAVAATTGTGAPRLENP